VKAQVEGLQKGGEPPGVAERQRLQVHGKRRASLRDLPLDALDQLRCRFDVELACEAYPADGTALPNGNRQHRERSCG
jgi:hypothetical protein